MPLPSSDTPDSRPRGEDAGPPPTIRPSLLSTIATRATATAATASYRVHSLDQTRQGPFGHCPSRATNRASPAESPPGPTPAGRRPPPAACACRWQFSTRKILLCSPQNSSPSSPLPATAAAYHPDPAPRPQRTCCPPSSVRRKNPPPG